jgi:hypothetical protein
MVSQILRTFNMTNFDVTLCDGFSAFKIVF